MAAKQVKQHVDTIFFDWKGSFLLKVTKNDHITYFSVSGVILRLACPSWWALERSSAVDPEPGNNRLAITLPDANATSVRIVLLIAHYKYDELPKSMELCELAEIAKLCSKYKLIVLAHFHVRHWLIPHIGQSLHKDNYADWLWIDWVFGIYESVAKTANYVLRTMSEDEVKEGPELPEGGQGKRS
jgi:hypothetical protein